MRPLREATELPKALASLGARSPPHGRPQPSTRFAGPPLRSGPADDCRGRPCGKSLRASQKAGPRFTPASATPASRSVVAEDRRQLPDGITPPGRERRPRAFRTPAATGRGPAHVEAIATRYGSKQAPSRSIAQATLSRRSATERRARACPWPRARSARYLSWLTGSRWAATRAQW